MVWRAKREESASRVALSYCVLITWRVWWGRSGFGAMIFEGESERPLGIEAVEMRRSWRLEDEREEEWVVEEEAGLRPGMSRMLSLRPVVGSVVWSLAGSWLTW
jgi:hypothetical protein